MRNSIPTILVKKLFISTSIAIALSGNAWAKSPRNITDNIPWKNWKDASHNAIINGTRANFSSTKDIEDAFNYARRQEEIQLRLAPNTIADLVMPPDEVWHSMPPSDHALFLINNERTARAGIDPGVIGLPFAGVENSIQSIAREYSSLLFSRNETGHFQPSGDSSIDSPFIRIEKDRRFGQNDSFIGTRHLDDISRIKNPDTGEWIRVHDSGTPTPTPTPPTPAPTPTPTPTPTSTGGSGEPTSHGFTGEGEEHTYGDGFAGRGACHEPLSRSENLAFFVNTSTDFFSIPSPTAHAIYNWVYDDAESGWGHREAVLLQDTALGSNDPSTGFNNNNGSLSHEGYIGFSEGFRNGYQPAFADFTVGTGSIMVLNLFDPVSDADASLLGCDYSNDDSMEKLATFLATPMIGIKAKDGAEGGANGEFTIERVSGDASIPLDVSIILSDPPTDADGQPASGFAVSGEDYSTISPVNVTIPANQSSVSVTLNIIDDDLVEGNETITGALAGSENYSVARNRQSARLTIVDNDAPNVSITAINGEEGGQNGAFTLTRTGDTSATLDITLRIDLFSSTAEHVSDYSATDGNVTGFSLNVDTTIPAGQSNIIIPINIVDDAIVEDIETVIAKLVSVGGVSTSGISATVLITDNDAVTLPVTDNDGVSDAIEQAAPNDGDGNFDGIPDHIQDNVASFGGSPAGSYFTLEVPDGSGCTIGSMNTTSEAALGSDVGFNYAIGLSEFTLNCNNQGASADIAIYLHGLTSAPTQLRKYGYQTSSSTSKDWYQVPGATIVKVDGENVYRATYRITDGGQGDDDRVANGVIVDPVGPAFAIAAPVVPTTPTSIPTLSEWAKYLLILSLIIIGVVTQEKSRKM